MDNLFEQMANISKAHGYDILVEQVSELKKENAKLREALKPFADMDSQLTENKKRQGGNVYQYNDAKLTVEDFAKAVEAMKETKFS